MTPFNFAQSKEFYSMRIQVLNEDIKVAKDSIAYYEQQINALKTVELKEKMANTSIKVTLKSGGKLKSEAGVFGNIVYTVQEDVQAEVTDYQNDYYFVCVGDVCGFANDIWLEGNTEDLIQLKIMKEDQEKVEYQQKIQESIAADKAKAEAEKKAKEDANKKIIEEAEKKYGKEKANKLLDGIIWIGCTKEMVILSWGKPEDINTTVTSYGKREQWVYGLGSYVYFKDGKVTAIQN